MAVQLTLFGDPVTPAVTPKPAAEIPAHQRKRFLAAIRRTEAEHDRRERQRRAMEAKERARTNGRKKKGS